MAIWRDDVRKALENIDGSGTLPEVYEAVSLIRESLPNTWQAIVRRELEYNSSDSESYKGNFDLFYSVEGIGSGVWGLRSKLIDAPLAEDIHEPPDRVETKVYRILRDTKLSKKLKALHKNKCQICGLRIKLSDGSYYSEAHHIKPLGGKHSGPDTSDNILILCPNHHVECDYGSIKLDKGSLSKVVGHRINSSFIDYHNIEIFK